MDLYKLYETAVQSPDTDVDFLMARYRSLRGRAPRSLREDFGGTGLMACRWVARRSEHRAMAVEISMKPINYGVTHHWEAIPQARQQNMCYLRADVLKTRQPADIITAFNFSYFVFKERAVLRRYFQAVRQSLRPGGVFFVDVLGGPECQTVMVEKTPCRGFTYFWDCTEFDPISHHCKFAIHFKPKGHRKIENAFTYDWRLWTIPEIRELMEEAGFKKSIVYWEGDDGRGSGNGVFRPAQTAENCEAWVTYIAALK